MERYEAYKDSGVEWIGEIPQHWDAGKILRHARLESGHTPSKQHPEWWLEEECTIPWITTGDVHRFRDGIMTSIDDTIEHVSQIGLDNSSARLLPAGTVALSRTASVGFSIVLNKPMASSQDFADWVPDDALDPFYLLYSLRSMDVVFEQLQMGSTHKTIYMPDIMKLAIAFPPLKEQRTIVEYLDAKTAEVDALVADCEREVGLLREYRKAVISEAVTKGLEPDAPMKDSGIEWIGEVPEGWLVAPLKHIVGSIESGTSLDGANWPASENEKGVLTLSSVYQSRFDAKQNKAVSPMLYERLSCPLRSGTLLISRCNTSEWVGTAAYVSDAPENLFLPDKLWQLSFTSDFTCRFIQYALQANAARNYFAALSVGASSTMQNIAKSDLLATPIAIPNDDGVEEIVTYLDAKTVEIDSLIEAKQQMADKLREYRKSLISEAVTGKFKVPGVS